MMPVYSRSSFAALLVAACILLSVFIAFSGFLLTAEASEPVPEDSYASVSDNSVNLDPVLDKLDEVNDSNNEILYAVITVSGVVVGVLVCFLIFR